MTQTTIEFEQRVDDRIQALLARCDAIRRGTTLDRPVVFDERGAAHARAVAARDGRTLSNRRSMPAVCRGPDPAEDPSQNQATPSSGGPSQRLRGQQAPAIERGRHVLPLAIAGVAQHDTARRECQSG